MEKPPLAASNTNETSTTTIRPTGEDIPNFHHFFNSLYDLSSDIIRFNEEEKEIRKLHNSERRKRLNFTDEQRKEHYAQKLLEYDEEIDDALTELHEWRAEIMMWEERIPNISDYNRKREEIHKALNMLVPRLKPESLFREGVDDTARCGQLLILMEKDWDGTEKEERTVCHMSALQWLIRQQAVDCVKMPKIIDEVNEGEEEKKTEVTSFNEALRIICCDCLHLDKGEKNTKVGEKVWNKNRLIVALMHVLTYRKSLPFNDEKSFAKQVAPIIGKDAENLRKSINRIQLTIKPYGRNLKELSERYIKRNPSNDVNAMTARNYKVYWDGMFELIDGFISTIEPLAPLRGNGAQKPSAL